jgi:GTPase Era involved in 16S rRNA processing
MYFFVLGASGLGKSTLVNTLFKAKLSRTSCIAQPFTIPKTVEIKTVSHGKCNIPFSNNISTTFPLMGKLS